VDVKFVEPLAGAKKKHYQYTEDQDPHIVNGLGQLHMARFQPSWTGNGQHNFTTPEALARFI